MGAEGNFDRKRVMRKLNLYEVVYAEYYGLNAPCEVTFKVAADNEIIALSLMNDFMENRRKDHIAIQGKISKYDPCYTDYSYKFLSIRCDREVYIQ